MKVNSEQNQRSHTSFQQPNKTRIGENWVSSCFCHDNPSAFIAWMVPLWKDTTCILLLCYRIDSSFHGKESLNHKNAECSCLKHMFNTMRKVYLNKKYHNINHKPFKNTPYNILYHQNSICCTLSNCCQFGNMLPVCKNMPCKT